MATGFTLTRGSVAGIGYGVVKRPNGEEICTAVWTESTRNWRNIEFTDEKHRRCNRTRQAACRALKSASGVEWTPEPVKR